MRNMSIKLPMVKLCTPCSDKASGVKGMITHVIVGMDRSVKYLFQPRGRNPEDGQPVPRMFLGQERLILPKNCWENVSVPFKILGTPVTDKASGFTGMAIEFVGHPYGCFHVIVQPKGVLPKTRCPIEKAEFDLRQCTGPMIKQLNAEQLKRSKKKKPSPTNLSIPSATTRVTSGLLTVRR